MIIFYMKRARFLFILIFSLFLFPTIVWAADCGSLSTYTGKLQCVLGNIALVLYVIAGGLALIVILIGGITYMTAGGSEDKVNKAKKLIFNGLLGAAIVVCAGFILDLLAEFLAPLL